MNKYGKKIVSLLCTASLAISGAVTGYPDQVSAEDTTVVTGNLALGHTRNTPEAFAGIYEYENLTLSKDAHITSQGISQLVIKVEGTLTVEEGADIRVRNGFYPTAPSGQIAMMNSQGLKSQGISKGLYNLYPGVYGKGGDGGNGGNGLSGSNKDNAGYGGNGGGGGYGGGIGGRGGSSEKQPGSNGGSNGGWGGGSNSGYGGGADEVGADGTDGMYAGNSGGGGGGNGGYGGRGAWGKDYGYGIRIGGGGSGGGGGGYGGGVLTIVAQKIVVHSQKPCFIVAGQKGGAGGNLSVGGEAGQNGEGGMLNIYTNDYAYDESHWKVKNVPSYNFGQARPVLAGGHGIVTGGPQKVFMNGAEYGLEAIPKEGIKAAVCGISISPDSLELKAGDRAELKVTVLPENAGNKNFMLISSDPQIAMVNSNVIIGLKNGTADVVAISEEGSFTAVCKVTVSKDGGQTGNQTDTVSVKKVKLNKTTVTLSPKETFQLKATVSPSNASNKTVSFKSANPKVAAVSGSGKITARKKGKTTVTVTTADQKKKASCTVKVVKAVPKFTKTKLTIKKNKTLNLIKYIRPSSAAKGKIKWSSQNKKIVKVSSKGIARGIKKGKTNVYAKIGKKKIKTNITVK